MLFTGAKKEALAIHEKAIRKYDQTITKVQQECINLYNTRQQSILLIKVIENLINGIANTPKEFDQSLSIINTAYIKFHDTETFAAEAYNNAVKSGLGAAVGVGAGAMVAGMAPTAAMWIATTFGTASTGTAISSLSGAAATKAALAWLGGGAIKAGGAGVVGGQALLALAGPIGWGLTATTIAGSILSVGYKNKEMTDAVIEEAKAITIAGADLNEACLVITNLHNETIVLLDKVKGQLNKAIQLGGHNYSDMSGEDQLLLGTLVNNTLALAEMLNKTVEQEIEP